MESAEAEVDQEAQPLHCFQSFSQHPTPTQLPEKPQSRRPLGHQAQSALLHHLPESTVFQIHRGQQCRRARTGPGRGASLHCSPTSSVMEGACTMNSS